MVSSSRRRILHPLGFHLVLHTSALLTYTLSSVNQVSESFITTVTLRPFKVLGLSYA